MNLKEIILNQTENVTDKQREIETIKDDISFIYLQSGLRQTYKTRILNKLFDIANMHTLIDEPLSVTMQVPERDIIAEDILDYLEKEFTYSGMTVEKSDVYTNAIIVSIPDVTKGGILPTILSMAKAAADETTCRNKVSNILTEIVSNLKIERLREDTDVLSTDITIVTNKSDTLVNGMIDSVKNICLSNGINTEIVTVPNVDGLKYITITATMTV